MVGDVAAPVVGKNCTPCSRASSFSSRCFWSPLFPGCTHGVLAEEQMVLRGHLFGLRQVAIRSLAGDGGLEQPGLQVPGLGVVDHQAQVTVVDGAHGAKVRSLRAMRVMRTMRTMGGQWRGWPCTSCAPHFTSASLPFSMLITASPVGSTPFFSAR